MLQNGSRKLVDLMCKYLRGDDRENDNVLRRGPWFATSIVG